MNEMSQRPPQKRETVERVAYTVLLRCTQAMHAYLPMLNRLPRVKSAANFLDFKTITGVRASACSNSSFNSSGNSNTP